MKLRPYQLGMVKHLRDHPRAALFALMGSGKTVSTLTALDQLDLSEKVFPALIIAPKRVAETTWPAEVKAWPHLSHLRVRHITGESKTWKQQLTGGADIYTIAIDNVARVIEFLDGRWYWPTVVVDEATRLKGYRLRQGGKRTRALAKVAFSRVTRWVNLTGTPAPNGLHDLWGQMWFIDRGERLGRSFSSFFGRWFYTAADGSVRAMRGAPEEIYERLADVCLTVDPRDYMETKDIREVAIEVDLPANTKAEYRKLARESLLKFEAHGGAKIIGAHGGALSMKLRQFASGAVYAVDEDEQSKVIEVHSAKLDALESLVEEQAGRPLLVAYQFRHDVTRIQARFPFARVGADPETILAWNNGEVPLLLLHPKSAGHGLNLQHGGCDIVFFSHDFNMEERVQIIERIGPLRQAQAGYDRVVSVYDIIAKGTVDELVRARVRGKINVNEALLNHMKGEA